MNKYHNKEKTVDGIKFQSIAEADRYSELKLMVKAKEIQDLRLQQRFVLQPEFEVLVYKLGLKRKIRKIEYVADFTYRRTDDPKTLIVEDHKGMKTDVYKIKKKLFLKKFPQHIFFEHTND